MSFSVTTLVRVPADEEVEDEAPSDMAAQVEGGADEEA